VALLLDDLAARELQVQVLVHALEHAADLQVVLELDRDGLANKRAEEGLEDLRGAERGGGEGRDAVAAEAAADTAGDGSGGDGEDEVGDDNDGEGR